MIVARSYLRMEHVISNDNVSIAANKITLFGSVIFFGSLYLESVRNGHSRMIDHYSRQYPRFK